MAVKKKKRPKVAETETESETGSAGRASRTLIFGGAVVSLAGIVAAAAGSNTLGGGATLAGWLALVYGIHRFGRTG
ncbi:MAG TPA: hypothetical protein VLM85_16815 [Polyangiaceae bacterium]|nr:hypothetical protein [Polyangiaceae bacterium]